jgi:L-asparaginase II
MTSTSYQPLFELTRGDAFQDLRGQIVESIHFGALAVVDAKGNLLASVGDPNTVTYLRSSAKPFQALPLMESGGRERYHLTEREVALICSYHSGTDEHVEAVKALQEKVGALESDLLCGTHAPFHEETAEALRQRGEAPTPNRHNCSGKHTGMIAYARLRGLPYDEYINPQHPIQRTIIAAFAEMCNLSVDQVQVGTDGCSVPNFAVPLYHAALAYARLCDPQTGGVTPPSRAQACAEITRAMMTHPEMVGGPGRFDTRLMQTAEGRIVSKGGAEGYQAIGIMPGVMNPASPGVGIAIKISDGDLKGRAIGAVSLEVLRQLGVLSASELELLAEFGPVFPLSNFRKYTVGVGRPNLKLAWTA